MKKKIVIILILLIFILGVVIILKKIEKNNTVNIYEYEYNEGTIYLDLDGDGKNEEIYLASKGEFIEIDKIKHIVNEEYINNYYHIVDLNNDGYLEIIHRTFDSSPYAISPNPQLYTIFNYKNNELVAIARQGLLGNIPRKIKVNGNTLEFEHMPFEANFTEKVTITLDV